MLQGLSETRTLFPRSSSSGRASSTCRCELQVKSVESPQDEGRGVAVATSVRRAVLLLVDADVEHPVQDPLEADPAFGPRQGAAGAGVHAPAEGQVLAGVAPFEHELGWVLELAGVAVG